MILQIHLLAAYPNSSDANPYLENLVKDEEMGWAAKAHQ